MRYVEKGIETKNVWNKGKILSETDNEHSHEMLPNEIFTIVHQKRPRFLRLSTLLHLNNMSFLFVGIAIRNDLPWQSVK